MTKYLWDSWLYHYVALNMTNLQTWIRHAAAIGSDEFSASNQVNLRPEHKANSTRLFNTVIVSMQVS